MYRLMAVCLILLVTSCSNPPARFVIGDMVCLKGVGSRGIVKSVIHHKWIGHYYKVIFTGGNQVTFLPKQHKLISKCEAK